jgi:hypothetical protein
MKAKNFCITRKTHTQTLKRKSRPKLGFEMQVEQMAVSKRVPKSKAFKQKLISNTEQKQ